MNNNDRSMVMALRWFALVFGLFCLWFLFSWTGPIHHAEVKMNAILPGWIVAANLVLLPCLALSAGEWRISLPLRLVLLALMLCSIVIVEVSFRRFLPASCGVLAILLVEAYWIVPKWNIGHRR